MYSRVYIHIPFCLKKCAYCSFFSITSSSQAVENYVSTLCHEIAESAQQNPSKPIRSIYFGGGTPSILTASQLFRIIEIVRASFIVTPDAEITLEANPKTVTYDSLRTFRESGINRLSIGIQSFNDQHLLELGRLHSASDAHEAFTAARNAGFDNISIDLIYGLPNEDMKQWDTDLIEALSLYPEHISVYGLTLEEGTLFHKRYFNDSTGLPDQDLSADMYEKTLETLSAAGYKRYELSNFARPGFYSDHNSGYWNRDGYIGFGAGAHSFLRKGYGVRYYNVADVEEYERNISIGILPHCDTEILTKESAMAEFIFLGLRMSEGVSLKQFANEFGESLQSRYGSELAKLQSFYLVELNGDVLKLTDRGMILSNQVFSCFV